MEVLQEDNGLNGKFFILSNGVQRAEMIYTWTGNDRIVINHTEVDDVLKGKSAGRQMINKAVDFAREKGIKIVPLCSFASRIFKLTPEIRDVL